MNLARNGRQDQLGASLVLDVGDWADAVIVEWVEQSLASVIKSSDNWNLATSHCVRNWQIQLQSTFNPKGILNVFLRDLKELLDYTQQWRWKQFKIGCAIHKIRPKYWVRKIFIFITLRPNIGCANAHLAHPVPPPLHEIEMSFGQRVW